LQLRPGATVLDVACGTGLNFAAIEHGIGPAGHLVGVDLSPDMLKLARVRVRAGAWHNVTLIESAAEDAELPTADAALFSYAHDVLRSPAAVHHVLDAVRPGGRVVAAGVMTASSAGPLNALVRTATRPYVTTLDGLDEPWSHLATGLVDLLVEPAMLGTAYIASGHRPIDGGPT
jgi:ubiquinone/menaquinone biosynthesis C-methylase UbiE